MDHSTEMDAEVSISQCAGISSPPGCSYSTPPIPLGPVGRRNNSNVPAQPLALLNDPFVIEQAHLWAQKAIATARAIACCYYHERFTEMPFHALPLNAELHAAMDFLTTLASERNLEETDWPKSEELWADYAHVLLNTKEFIYLP